MIGMMTVEDEVLGGQHPGQQTSGTVRNAPTRRCGPFLCQQPDGGGPPQDVSDTHCCRDCSGLRSV